MRSFLRMCNVYRRFVRNFTRIVSPLNIKTRKDQPIEIEHRNEEKIETFETLRQKLITKLILALPRHGCKYTLDRGRMRSPGGIRTEDRPAQWG